MKPVTQLLLALAASAFAVPASAQDIVYAEGFESGLTGWTATGLWNLEDVTDSCGAQAAPFVEGTKCAWYGSNSTCNYEPAGSGSGTLTMTNFVQLPVATSISVHFWMWSESEYCFQDPNYYNQYDVFSLVVQRESPAGSLTSVLCTPTGASSVQLGWHERRFDISAYSGQRVKLSFQFGSGDNIGNGYLGWFVDDVQILAEPGVRQCPATGFVTGCPCQPVGVPVAGGCRNSTTRSATLFTSGSTSVSNDTLLIRCENMNPNASTILTQASGTSAGVIFGDGFRCISGQLLRMGAVQAQNGVATWPPAGTDPIATRGQIPPAGGIRYYYVFYRDINPTYCSPSLFNLSDNQRIVWTP
jgi:hypothetical protein